MKDLCGIAAVAFRGDPWLNRWANKEAIMAEGQGTGGRLTTHVLDTALGRPAAGMVIWLYRVSGNSHRKIAEVVTNDDGRTAAPLLRGKDLVPGTYELVFHAGDYLRKAGLAGAEPLFLDQIPIRFGIADAAGHYHVPLLISPYSYGTYRGS